MRRLRQTLIPIFLAGALSAVAQVRIVVARGAIEGGAYVNRSIGISYQYPDGWLGIAEPVSDSRAARLLLKAQPRDAADDHRLITLQAVAQKDLPADQRTEPAHFLLTHQAAKLGALNELRQRTQLGVLHPVDVSTRPFLRADYKLSAAHGQPAMYETQIAGVVNGHMLLFCALAPSETAAGELAETVEDLNFSPPADPEDAPTQPIIIEQRPDTMKRIRQSESAARARVRTKVEPEYPAEARDRGVEGEVLLQVVVGADGSVAQATVISGHPLLNDAALEAVKQWKFDPYVLDGQAVETDTKVRIRFSLISAKQSS